MSELLKSGTALSHGVIFNAEAKKKQSKELAAQTEAFLSKGGKVEQVNGAIGEVYEPVQHLNKGAFSWAAQRKESYADNTTKGKP